MGKYEIIDNLGGIFDSRNWRVTAELHDYDEEGNLLSTLVHFRYFDPVLYSKEDEYEELVAEFNSKNLVTHICYPNDMERWIEYDENDNLIHVKYLDGFEYWNEYDDKGNMTFHKNSHGEEFKLEHDENGNLTHLSSPHMSYWRDINDEKDVIRYIGDGLKNEEE